MKRLLSALILALATGVLSAQAPHGLFTGSSDIGKTLPGASVYDAASQSYRVTGGGADMWFAADDFHLTWVKLSGNVAITARVGFPTQPAQPLAKAVLIVRQSLAPESAYADVAIHADGHITLQWREKSGDPTKDLTAPEHKSTTLRLERKGDVFTAYAAQPDGTLTPFASYTVPMTGDVYVGLGVCAHDANGLASATFSNVKIEPKAH
jgi:regulation of enolase protein 1 (concanavalin A-like superfamily)